MLTLRTMITVLFSCLVFYQAQAHAQSDEVSISVWTNEAIVATYTYDYQNYLTRQQSIAQYFTATAWIDYNKALQSSKLIQSVQENKYTVSAVAAMPPSIKQISSTRWRAVMPILVIYKNPRYQQKQTLEVTIDIDQAAAGAGVRGLAINSMTVQSKALPCQCPVAQLSPSVTIT